MRSENECLHVRGNLQCVDGYCYDVCESVISNIFIFQIQFICVMHLLCGEENKKHTLFCNSFCWDFNACLCVGGGREQWWLFQ